MSTTTWQPMLNVPVSPARDHIRGIATAPVTLVEYGDYECPYCGLAHAVIHAVEEQAGDRLAFVFRHFPLTNIHPHAAPAAEAAEAAGAQGKFWPMHDLLYENQQHLEATDLLAYAGSLGLDIDQFSRDLAQGAYNAKIADDFMSGVRSGVNGTPTFYINGRRHDGGWDLVSLTAALQATVAL